MASQTGMVLLLILATAATTLATDFEKLVKAEESRRSSCSTCCPFGWVKYGGRCFTYQASSVDWASAENRCQYLDGHLVSIHSENDYQLVKALIRVHDHYENPTWIGLAGCEKKFNFFWSDGTKLTYTKWNPNEPNFHSAECCVHMNSDYVKNWNDVPCGHSYPFVCAKRLR